MKMTLWTGSWIASALCWLLLSALAFFILLLMRDRARLIRDNDNERLLNALFTSLRSDGDFGSVIEANPLLGERIAGFGIYGDDLLPVYRWGRVPLRFDEKMLEKQRRSRNGRYTIPDRQGRGVKFVLSVQPPPPPPGPRHNNRMGQVPGPPPLSVSPPENIRERRRGYAPGQNHAMFIRPDFGFFNIMANGKYFYIDISHPAYWGVITFTTILFPLSAIIILILVLYIRNLYMRNREYRDRIEAQKNLVVLGTAASILAHEIKNPLLSIRLQTGILEKMYPENGGEELDIINEEVDRLSGLTFRINDYIRDTRGNPQEINVFELLRETSQRLCGRNIIEGGPPQNKIVFMDADRLRSVLENLIRNALESGGAEEDIAAAIGGEAGKISITVFDRGRGIAEADMRRAFDPFFSRKSAGTGIGLSICKRFVEAAGGEVSLENREGGGIAAAIRLPGEGDKLGGRREKGGVEDCCAGAMRVSGRRRDLCEPRRIAPEANGVPEQPSSTPPSSLLTPNFIGPGSRRRSRTTVFHSSLLPPNF
jgi:two-component system sensor histidine kinase HydH